MPRKLHFLVPLVGFFVSHPAPGHEEDDHHHGNEVSIVEKEGYRVITSNGLPNHETGKFPNNGNPHRITAQHHRFRVTLTPKIARQPTDNGLAPFGIAVNGLVFDPGAAEFWRRDRRSGWQYEALGGTLNLGLDQNHAHVQPTGAYHYHGLPTGLVKKLQQPGKMTLLGWAADGFPIYSNRGHAKADDPNSPLKEFRSSYRLKRGKRPNGPRGRYDGTFVQDFEYVEGAGDLDDCNGRFGVTPEYPEGIYHYYITAEFPFIPRKFKGTPDPSFQRRGPRGPGGPGRPPFPPPRGGRPPFPPPRRGGR